MDLTKKLAEEVTQRHSNKQTKNPEKPAVKTQAKHSQKMATQNPSKSAVNNTSKQSSKDSTDNSQQNVSDVPIIESNTEKEYSSGITHREIENLFVEPNLPGQRELDKENKGFFDKFTHKMIERISQRAQESEREKIQHKMFGSNFETLEKTNTLTLSIDNIYKRFGKKHAVNGVSFDIHTGEVVGFLGPNGAGKTTVFYMIVGFLMPDKGSILFNGVSMERLAMYKRARLGISYLPQEPSVFRRLSVEKNIIAVLQTIRGFKRAEMKNRLDSLIAEFGLTEFRQQKAFTLSGGERRRTEIARGMALHPYFLLLDEPFTGIDPKARFELKQIIASLSKKGVGVLITDHNERDTLSITDRAFILHEGKIVASGSREDIMSNKNAREIYLGEEYD